MTGILKYWMDEEKEDLFRSHEIRIEFRSFIEGRPVFYFPTLFVLISSPVCVCVLCRDNTME